LSYRYIIRFVSATFRKETSKGWSHDVVVALARTKDNKCLLKWGTRCLDVLDLNNIMLRQEQGKHYYMHLCLTNTTCSYWVSEYFLMLQLYLQYLYVV